MEFLDRRRLVLVLALFVAACGTGKGTVPGEGDPGGGGAGPSAGSPTGGSGGRGPSAGTGTVKLTLKAR